MQNNNKIITKNLKEKGSQRNYIQFVITRWYWTFTVGAIATTVQNMSHVRELNLKIAPISSSKTNAKKRR